jgi:hypothetical protein
MKGLLTIFSAAIFALIVGCGEHSGHDGAGRPKTATRTFKDKQNSSEVETISNLASAVEIVSARISKNGEVEARRTPVEIYVIKNPEFNTYYRNGEGHKLSIVLLAVEGELLTAAYASTGDVNKVARKKIVEDGKVKYVLSRGVDVRQGTYSIDFLSPRHTSDSFSDAMMHNAIFFHGGIALHETAKENYGQLGRVASMGCVRLNRAAAEKIFATVRQFADRNSKGVIYGYSNTTVNVIERGGALDRFSEEQILEALVENFREEKALGPKPKQ